MPSTITRDEYYRTYPGRYELQYIAWDGSMYGAEYTIYVEEGGPGQPGEPGGWFWQGGADGSAGADGFDL